jgi:hypothetical protein
VHKTADGQRNKFVKILLNENKIINKNNLNKKNDDEYELSFNLDKNQYLDQ